ncbi:hypothetical protein KJ966_28285 [bacterium]|nr:hypothetical protein [bacterium]
MKSPKEQRRKFDETMEAGFWQVGENVEVINHNNLSVSTTSYWSRDFKAVKKQKQILKSTRSLLVRAAEYADILELKAEIIIGEYPPETFSYHTDQPSDYFKNKTWR